RNRVVLAAPELPERADLFPLDALLAAQLDEVDVELGRSVRQEVLAQSHHEAAVRFADDRRGAPRPPGDRAEAPAREHRRLPARERVPGGAAGEHEPGSDAADGRRDHDRRQEPPLFADECHLRLYLTLSYRPRVDTDSSL